MVQTPYASVAVARPVRGEFTYLLPDEWQGSLTPGERVLVPFGRGLSLGFYLGPCGPPKGAGVALKAIQRRLDARPALPLDVLRLLRFAAAHYRYPLGEAIRTALPPGLGEAEEERAVAEDLEWMAEALPEAQPSGLGRAKTQAAALSYLLAVGGRARVEEICHAIPGAKGALERLSQRQWVRLSQIPAAWKGARETSPYARPESLTAEQSNALSKLTCALDAGGFSAFLLHGVTGSGKTEVYLRLVEHALQKGKGSLVLVPEIALTPQLVGRFHGRFGKGIAVLHSGLKDRERLKHWQALRSGEVRIAVGVRSAVFAPVENLGAVVVDEEHDPSFKQEEKLRYQARDLAVVRGKFSEAVVVLGSATPSLESYENARRGRYQKLELGERVQKRPMPAIEVVDLRISGKQNFRRSSPQVLSEVLLASMQRVLEKGQQVILFLNRRGHSTFLICEVCGLPLRCRLCDVSLTHHLSVRGLLCHYCGSSSPMPSACPECQGPLLKLGAGTEKVEAEVAARFPKSRVARLDRDAVSSQEKLTELLSAFARREIDVLVGTQMVAKGHDFPGVTLVAAVLADASLALPDFRAAERTFQLLAQVAGRAGRGSDPGRVLLQAYHSGAEAICRVLTHDFAGFAESELAWRRALVYPPYSRLAAIRVEGTSPSLVERVSKSLSERIRPKLPSAPAGVRLLGPALAPISKIKGKTRWQLLLKGPSYAALGPALDEVERAFSEVPSSVKVVIDVDPSALL